MELTEKSFQSYKQFLIDVYPRVASRKFKALWEEVEFCRGSVEDFPALTLVRFLLDKGLHNKVPQCLSDDDVKWQEESKKYDMNTEEGANAWFKAFEEWQHPDTSNVFYEYTIDENFKIENLMTKEMAKKFYEHYNQDLEYWSK